MYWNLEVLLDPKGKMRWIVTLDVLKFYTIYNSRNSLISWIVTLDVLRLLSDNEELQRMTVE